jgi:5'-nucleotidase
MLETILIDVDGVVAQTHTEWLRRYNHDWNDHLTSEMITNWGIHEFVKPECGTKIYKYLSDPDLYDNVEPVPHALWGVNTLRSMQHRCVFLSAGVHAGKRDFLFRHGFITTEKDLIIAQDKSLIMGQILIDDGVHNIQDFKQGTGVLFHAKHNEYFDYLFRAYDWHCVVELVSILEGRERMASYMSYGKGE